MDNEAMLEAFQGNIYSFPNTRLVISVGSFALVLMPWAKSVMFADYATHATVT